MEKSLENPEAVKEALIDGIRDLVPEGTNIERDFTPPYMPWQQRLVVTPDGEFFTHMREGNLSVVTGNIAEFTGEGIELDSGTLLEADLVVSATGFDLIPFASIPFTVDGEHVSFPERVAWRDVMIEEIPNMAYIAGNLRASWTFRVDLVFKLMIRVLAEKERLGAATVAPRVDGTYAGMPRLPWADETQFSSGYIRKSIHLLPSQGDKDPWPMHLDYSEERETIPAAGVHDGLVFT